MENYYNEQYFDYQKEQGLFAAKAMKQFFEPYISANDNLLDFGCGGGFLLNELKAKNKLGIEINASARKYAKEELKITAVHSIAEVEDGWADILISSHALEHTLRPYDILTELLPKLKIGGTVVFIVPHETKYKFNEADVNKHLYTWSEMNIGNLFMEAGYTVIESRELVHRFPPNHKKLYSMFGEKYFNVLCRIYGVWARYRHMTQVRIIAKRVAADK